MTTENKEILSQIEKKQWEGWLHDENISYVKKIRQAVTQIHEENAEQKGDLPFFTPHGTAHCEAVEELIHRLLPGDSFLKLYEKERFFLLAAAWLHDLGMERIVSYSVWNEYLNPTEIRKRHHETSARFITSQYKRCGVEEQDKEFLSQLCRFHRKQEDLANCPEELMVGQKSYPLRKLAAYLRLADALHVDHSRTPTSSYAVCLSYNMSTESKLHWIKSRLVSGINILPDEHIIKIEFKIPCLIKQNLDFNVLKKKIDYIIDNVLDDIRKELSSVINVLTRTGPTYYLDVEEVRAEVFMDDQAINDLFELAMNFHIVGAPSASRLLEMILMTIANIAGYQLKKGAIPKKIGIDYAVDESITKNKIKEFIDGMSAEVLMRRPCHLGLSKLLKMCDNYSDKDLSLLELTGKIDFLFQQGHKNLLAIRNNASKFFNKRHILDQSTDNTEIDFNSFYELNILLFGYSETVIEALCGFRDSLINQHLCDNFFNIEDCYGSRIESKVSDNFRIFVCEGQPKTQTTYGDKLMYHDGIQYAKTLRDRKFNNIIIVPDIVAGNIIKNININYFLVGANGFTEKVFKHSAGHESIISIIKNQRQENPNECKTKIILVASSDKYEPFYQPQEDSRCNKVQESEEKFQIEGYSFWKSNKTESVRTHVWIGRDKAVYDEIHDSNCIMFYNPREDNVPIKNLDWIISDKDTHPINSGNGEDLSKNIANFIDLMTLVSGC